MLVFIIPELARKSSVIYQTSSVEKAAQIVAASRDPLITGRGPRADEITVCHAIAHPLRAAPGEKRTRPFHAVAMGRDARFLYTFVPKGVAFQVDEEIFRWDGDELLKFL